MARRRRRLLWLPEEARQGAAHRHALGDERLALLLEPAAARERDRSRRRSPGAREARSPPTKSGGPRLRRPGGAGGSRRGRRPAHSSTRPLGIDRMTFLTFRAKGDSGIIRGRDHLRCLSNKWPLPSSEPAHGGRSHKLSRPCPPAASQAIGKADPAPLPAGGESSYRPLSIRMGILTRGATLTGWLPEPNCGMHIIKLPRRPP